MRFVIINVCWGQEYTRFFVKHSLPSSLAMGNIPYLRAHGEVIYRLYTTGSDLAVLQQTPVFRFLSEVVQVDVKIIPSVQEKYSTMISCHSDAARAVIDGETRLLYFAPDILFSDGSMKCVVQAAEQGRRALMISALQTYYMDQLINKVAVPPIQWSLSARALVQWALQHPDDYTIDNIWRSDGVVAVPAVPAWLVGTQGYVCHLLIPHPIMLWPRTCTPPPLKVLDYYMPIVCKSMSELDLVQDSDTLCILTKRHSRDVVFQLGLSPIPYAKQFVSRFHPLMRECFRYPLRFHTKDMEKEEWLPIESVARTVVESILGGNQGG